MICTTQCEEGVSWLQFIKIPTDSFLSNKNTFLYRVAHRRRRRRNRIFDEKCSSHLLRALILSHYSSNKRTSTYLKPQTACVYVCIGSLTPIK